ncbi:hypothetical protein [Bremerella sp.]|uniref:hypothetical protein n=1 Tax=Bremerella sp. TaxID=2795602 RepID=UPI00391A2239
MHWLKICHVRRVVLGALCVWGTCCEPLSAEPIRPEFPTLKRIVEQYFYNARDRQRPILLTQSQVLDLLESLRGMHIYIPGRNQIARSFPHDREFFTQFVLDELAQDPPQAFPQDPTFMLQRIDAMCTSHDSIFQLERISGQGKSFGATWVSEDPLIPSLESARLRDMLKEHGVENAAEAKPRRRNYTIKHLLEELEIAYPPTIESASFANSLDALGR